MLLNTLEHVLPGPSWEQWGSEHPNTSHEDICNYWRSEGKFQVLSLSDTHLIYIYTHRETRLAHTHAHIHTHTQREEYKIRPQFRIKLTSGVYPMHERPTTSIPQKKNSLWTFFLMPPTPPSPLFNHISHLCFLFFLSFFLTAERRMEGQFSTRLKYIKK